MSKPGQNKRAAIRARVSRQGRSTGYRRLGLMANRSWNQDPRRTLFTMARYKFVSKMLEGRQRVLEVGCADAFCTRLSSADRGARHGRLPSSISIRSSSPTLRSGGIRMAHSTRSSTTCTRVRSPDLTLRSTPSTFSNTSCRISFREDAFSHATASPPLEAARRRHFRHAVAADR